MERIESSALLVASPDRVPQLIALLSHETRQPLAVITGFADLLSRETLGTLNNDQRSAVGFIRSNAHHLMRRLDRTLTVLALDTGRWPQEREELEILTVVRAQIDLAELWLTPGRPRPSIAVEGPATAVRTNRWLFEQVVVELLENACHSSPDYGAKVAISCQPVNERIELVFATNGSENSEEFGRNIVQLQAGDDGNSLLGDNGLSAVIVHRAVDLLGGVVTLATTVGGGSVVTVLLPN